MSEQQDFVLGRNVTEQAKAVEGRGSVVLSIRLSASELEFLSNIAVADDKTLSQVVREAIRQWRSNRQRETRRAAVSFPNGGMLYFGDTTQATFTTGDPQSHSGAKQGESPIRVLAS
jgi:hypothetical protein